jgi:hypothetical protein
LPLEIGAAQTRIGDDAIELRHQRRLGQDRQLLQVDPVVRESAERIAIVGRMPDRMTHDLLQPRGLIFEQSLARPTLAFQHLCAQRLRALAIDIPGMNSAVHAIPPHWFSPGEPTVGHRVGLG